MKSELASENSCILTFGLYIANEGITPFDVGWYKIRAWRRDEPPRPQQGKLLSLDLDEWQRLQPVVDENATFGLPRHLASGRKYDNTFHWVAGREKDTGWHLFRADAYDKSIAIGDTSKASLATTTSWVAGICQEESAVTVSKTKR